MWTLSTGDALTSWIDPLLTTVRSRWVCPPGPAPTGTPAPLGAAWTTLATFSWTATEPPPASVSPPALAFAARLRSSRCAGMRGSAAGSLAAAAPDAGAASAGSDVAAFSRAACARFRRCSGISVMHRSLAHSGPEMPPSLRTRQKWIAMKMTMTNGSISTCSTYQRSSVSAPISLPPSSTNRTCSPNTGV